MPRGNSGMKKERERGVVVFRRVRKSKNVKRNITVKKN